MFTDHCQMTFPKNLAPSLCKTIIQMGEAQPLKDSVVVYQDGFSGGGTLARSSKQSWMDPEGFLEELIVPYLEFANKEHDSRRFAPWNYILDLLQPIQYTVYGPGGFYSWHADAQPSPYKEGAGGSSDYDGLVRKLSFTIQLSDPATYEGGELMLNIPRPPGENPEYHITEKSQGSIVIFPSFIYHQVLPVTSGTRRALVGWMCGPTFR